MFTWRVLAINTYNFPENLYSDVRVENISYTKIRYCMGELEELVDRGYNAAFIRVFDGKRWYYSSVSELSLVQKELDLLATMAKPCTDIMHNPVVEKLQANKGRYISFESEDISANTSQEKCHVLESYFTTLEHSEAVSMWKAVYEDKREIKEIYSSKGAELVFDVQRCGIDINFDMSDGENKFTERFQRASSVLSGIAKLQDDLKTVLKECVYFLKNAKPVTAGRYTVILAPIAAGIFAHESFGHKSEADFMIGDEMLVNEWKLGEKIGSKLLSIIDDGNIKSSGFTPYDDEGTKACTTYLIKNGILTGRLHSSSTAAYMEEVLTGNSRAISYEFEPIVRMTTTFISAGEKTKEQLFEGVDEGIFVETIKHGSGLSTFTLAPSRAYMIKNGIISEPVSISVISGSVFETLEEIDGISDKVELFSFVLGGCGKIEQYPLSVSFGGPYVRVKSLKVQ